MTMLIEHKVDDFRCLLATP